MTPTTDINTTPAIVIGASRGGNVVAGILDHGRDESFVVHTLDSADPPPRVSRPVYTVTDFS